MALTVSGTIRADRHLCLRSDSARQHRGRHVHTRCRMWIWAELGSSTARGMRRICPRCGRRCRRACSPVICSACDWPAGKKLPSRTNRADAVSKWICGRSDMQFRASFCTGQSAFSGDVDRALARAKARWNVVLPAWLTNRDGLRTSARQHLCGGDGSRWFLVDEEMFAPIDRADERSARRSAEDHHRAGLSLHDNLGASQAQELMLSVPKSAGPPRRWLAAHRRPGRDAQE